MNKKVFNFIKLGTITLFLASCTANESKNANKSYVSDSMIPFVSENKDTQINYKISMYYAYGETYNFDDIFEVKNNDKRVSLNEIDCEFTVAQGYEDIVIIRDDYKFYVNGRGEFKINVRIKDSRGTFQGLAATRKEMYFRSASSGCDEYTIYKVDGVGQNRELTKWLVHGEYYVVIYGENMSDGNAPENLIAGGYIKLRNHNTYKFNYLEGNQVDILGSTRNLAEHPLHKTFNLPITAFSIEQRTRNPEGYVLKIDRVNNSKYDFDDPNNIFKSNKLDTMVFDETTYVPCSAAFDRTIDREGHEYWLMEVDYALETYPYTKVDGMTKTYAFDFDCDRAKIPELDDYIENAPLPE